MFQFEMQPRLSETDSLGHINNTFLPAWFEEARRELFRLFNPSLVSERWNIIVKGYTIDFVAQISYIESVRIDTLISHLGNSSLVLAQTACQEGKTVATCSCTLIHFDYESQRVAPIPTAVRQLLEPHVQSPAHGDG